jgi:hypothetical protein
MTAPAQLPQYWVMANEAMWAIAEEVAQTIAKEPYA